MGCIRVAAPGVVIRNSKISCPGFIAVAGCRRGLQRHAAAAGGLGDRLPEHGRDRDRRRQRHRSAAQHPRLREWLEHRPERHRGGQLHPRPVQRPRRRTPTASSSAVTSRTVSSYRVPSTSPSVTTPSTGWAPTDRSAPRRSSPTIPERPRRSHRGQPACGRRYTLYCNSPGAGTNYRVINNHFSRKFSPKVGYFGLSTDCADETQSGNVYHETGRPLRLG